MSSKLNALSDEKFKRLTGIRKTTFKKMIEILTPKHLIKKSRGGRRNKLSLERQLLATLEYLREYRTYFHIAQSYGISESTAFKIIKWVENILAKSKEFSLPGKKELQKSNTKFEVILVDATETPCQKPKKNNAKIILEKRKNIQ